MAYYYYPLTTRDFAFENIFSSESISPAIYYQTRAFGFNYFPVMPGINDENAIVLYNRPPIYQDENNAKFILKINEEAINQNDLVFIGEGIFAYYGTIYFQKKWLNVLFFNAKELKVAVLKANSSLPTKATEKYSGSFSLLGEDDCNLYPAVAIGIVKMDKKIEIKIALDKKYNHFKGFIYGLVIGHLANDRKRDFGLKARFQDITNAFAELKSRLDDQISAKFKDDRSKALQPYISNLSRVMSIAEDEYLYLTQAEAIDDEKIVEYVLRKQSRLKTVLDVSKYLDYLIVTDELLGRNDFKKIIDLYLREHSPSSKVFLQLQDYIKQFIAVFSAGEKTRHIADEINHRIKILLRNAIEDYLQQLSRREYTFHANLERISYDYKTNEVMLNNEPVYINLKSDNEFNFIVNAILKFAKSNRGPAQRERILQIVEEIGSSYTKRGKDTLLYQYLDNRIDVYSLDNASNLVMKNFVAFVFNPDSLEKLDDFLINKAVDERWMAFSFWGAYNGFANISRNYTGEIFNSSNIPLQDRIDTYLRQYIDVIIQHNSEDYRTITNVNDDMIEEVLMSESQDDWLMKIYNHGVANNYNLTFEQFKEAFKLTQLKDFQDHLKSKFQINKKDSQKLFNLLKKYFDSNALFH